MAAESREERPDPVAEVCEVDGLRIEILHLDGTSNGPGLIFLHEGLGSATQWKDFPWQIGARLGLPVLAYSRRGHGGSSALDAPRGPRFMHEEAQQALPRLLEALSGRLDWLGGPLVLVGHSDGASIALLHAALLPAAAVVGIVAIAPHVFVEAASITGVEQARRAYAETDLAEKLAKYHRDPTHTFAAWTDIWLHPDFRSWNIEALMSRVRIPVLLIQGRQDEYGTMAQCAAIARAVEAPVDVLELAACGHNPPRGRPVATSDAIVSFVRQVAGDVR